MNEHGDVEGFIVMEVPAIRAAEGAVAQVGEK